MADDGRDRRVDLLLVMVATAPVLVFGIPALVSAVGDHLDPCFEFSQEPGVTRTTSPDAQCTSGGGTSYGRTGSAVRTFLFVAVPFLGAAIAAIGTLRGRAWAPAVGAGSYVAAVLPTFLGEFGLGTYGVPALLFAALLLFVSQRMGPRGTLRYARGVLALVALAMTLWWLGGFLANLESVFEADPEGLYGLVWAPMLATGAVLLGLVLYRSWRPRPKAAPPATDPAHL